MSRLTTLFQIWPMGLSASVFRATGNQTKCPICHSGMVGERSWENVWTDLFESQGLPFTDWVGGGADLLISNKVLHDIQDAGLSGYEAYPIRIGKLNSSTLERLPKPDYFLLRITGRVDIDRQLFDEFDGELCEVCHKWTPRKGGKYKFGEKKTIPVLNTWDGNDFILVNNVKANPKYCSRKVIDLAAKKRWTGFAVRVFTGTGKIRIDHTSPNWLAEVEKSVTEVYPEYCQQ